MTVDAQSHILHLTLDTRTTTIAILNLATIRISEGLIAKNNKNNDVAKTTIIMSFLMFCLKFQL